MARKKSAAARARKATKTKSAAHGRKHSPAVKRRKGEPHKREDHEFETLVEIFPPGV